MAENRRSSQSPSPDAEVYEPEEMDDCVEDNSQPQEEEEEEYVDPGCPWCHMSPCASLNPLCYGRWLEEHGENGELLQRGKRVRAFQQSQLCDEQYDAFYEEPDLRSYFAQFQLSEQSQIALCRTFANYLAQKTRVAKNFNKKK